MTSVVAEVFRAIRAAGVATNRTGWENLDGTIDYPEYALCVEVGQGSDLILSPHGFGDDGGSLFVDGETVVHMLRGWSSAVEATTGTATLPQLEALWIALTAVGRTRLQGPVQQRWPAEVKTVCSTDLPVFDERECPTTEMEPLTMAEVVADALARRAS